ncbi:MAG TPA: quinone-dependent dihydroorotate dehydrogenase [Dongiaceae bacterium]|jgi:dihydroorotate dehydrogenase|nr:quinone-dependent dihydroorotate dehydrogenase [Dongiaceae bacterium]
MDIYSAIRPVLWRLDPERAHHLALWALTHNLVGVSAQIDDPRLAVTVFGRRLPNPIGLAAGFDKDARAWRQAGRLGFGFVEVGSVTPRPQAGNPRPRLFRLERDRAIINRMGFNNEGVEAMAGRLAETRPGAATVLGINLGKNKETEDAAADYEIGARRLGPFADYMVINVSSPNTPGLRALQGKAPLRELIGRTHRTLADSCGATPPPLLLKIAPDLTQQDLADIAEVALEGLLAGLIATNTTIARPANLDARYTAQAGGLSGRPLFEPSTVILRELYRLTQGKLPIIGVGGVSSGGDAYAKIRAGASLVQLYSALVFEGPSLIRRMKQELLRCLERDGLASIGEAIGLDHR